MGARRGRGRRGRHALRLRLRRQLRRGDHVAITAGLTAAQITAGLRGELEAVRTALLRRLEWALPARGQSAGGGGSSAPALRRPSRALDPARPERRFVSGSGADPPPDRRSWRQCPGKGATASRRNSPQATAQGVSSESQSFRPSPCRQAKGAAAAERDALDEGCCGEEAPWWPVRTALARTAAAVLREHKGVGRTRRGSSAPLLGPLAREHGSLEGAVDSVGRERDSATGR